MKENPDRKKNKKTTANNKFHKGIGILTKPRKYVQEKAMQNLFNSFLKPYIDYGNLGWGGTPKTKIELITRTIKRSITTVKPFYECLEILPFKHNMKLLQGKFTWKLVNAVHPNSISEMFPLI